MKTLYKRTSTGKIQIWRQEVKGDSYRTISGQKDGKQVTSEWTKCTPKNVGKANETTAEEQCLLEVESNYKKKLAQGKYHTEMNDVDNATFFAPMLAKDWHDYEHLYEKGDSNAFSGMYSQPKLDGVRCILKADGMWSRNGKPIVSCPHIIESFKPWFEKNPDHIFDGELYSDRLADNFQKIISLARQQKPTEKDFIESEKYLKLHIYDFPTGDGCFSRRYSDLFSIFARMTKEQFAYSVLVETECIENKEHMDKLYASYMEAGFEGQMIRRDKGRYACKRSDQLLKRKEFIDKEFKVLDIIEGEGNWTGLAKSIRIELENGDEQNTGMRGNRAFARKLLEEKQKWIGGETTIRYQRLSNDGRLIFPVAVAFYKKKRDI